MTLNQQPVEKSIRNKQDGYSLDVVDIFSTMQGEGIWSGDAAIFVRLAGCNLMCPWCDTDYTSNRRTMQLGEILDQIEGMQTATPRGRVPAIVIITGGEPFRQNIDVLVKALLAVYAFGVQIESNGIFGPSDEFLHLMASFGQRLMYCVSPKTSAIHENARFASFFKYVIQEQHVDADDGLPTKSLQHKATPRVARPPAEFKGPIYVTPMDEKDAVQSQLNLHAARDSALKYGYTLNVQLHKLVNLP